MTAAEWLNVVGLILMVFMLLSYLVLPAQKTRSHYLSVCLIVSVVMITLGFVIPLGAEPDKCYDEITPNDMYSSIECAWSGAFIVAGGLTTVMWIFVRALSMNLQICWDIVPGRKFFYISQGLGWGIPAILFTATMTVTGVSFRFASQCDVNHQNSMEDFWGPLLALSGAAGILQLMTLGYCIRVYLKNLFADEGASSSAASGSNLPSYTQSVRTQTARAVWRRLQKVIWLQWRGICIVTIILVDVIFFSIVFVWFDRLQSNIGDDLTKIEPWLTCLAFHPTDKDACLNYVGSWLVKQPTVLAVMLLLSLAGMQVFLFLMRPSVFTAWVDLFRSKFTSRQEFVSLDARQHTMRSNSKQDLINYNRGHESLTFEMQKPSGANSLSLDIESKGMFSPSTVSSPSEAHRSPLHHIGRPPSGDTDIRNSVSSSLIGRGRIPPEYQGRMSPSTNPAASPPTPQVHYNSISLHQRESDYFMQSNTYTSNLQRPTSSRSRHSDRGYHPPTTSFSAPYNPSRTSSVRSVTFDPREAYSRGGLALNPPSEAGESQEDLTRGAHHR